MHKYGIKIPTSVDHAYEICNSNKDTFFQDAIHKEMNNFGFSFEIIDLYCHVPLGWNKFTGNMAFDVKMDFRRKSYLVLGGHSSPDPE